MIAKLVVNLTKFMVSQKYQNSSIYGFPIFFVLLIDSNLRVSVDLLTVLY